MDPSLTEHLQRHSLFTDDLYPLIDDPHFDQPPPAEHSERDDIRAFISKLVLSEQEILEAIELLRRKQSDIRRSRDYHHAVISPIRNIPEEILAKIFLKTLSTTDRPRAVSTEEPFSCPYDSHSTPWRLTYVCRRWRSVATNLPHLWPRRVELILSHPPSRSDANMNKIVKPLSQGALHLTELCLERSYPLLIDLNLSCSGLMYEEPREPPKEWTSAFISTLQALFHYSTRFHHFFFSLTRLKLPCEVLNASGIATPHFPRLRSIAYGQRSPAPAWLMDAMMAAPDLHELRTDSISFFPSVILPRLSSTLGGITRLSLEVQHWANPDVALLLLFAAMPNLEHCRLRVQNPGYSTDQDELQKKFGIPPLPEGPVPNPVKLSKLTDFILDAEAYMDSFMSRLTLSALERVDMVTEDPSLSSFINRVIRDSPSQNITSLAFEPRISEDGDGVDDFLDILRNLSELQSLTLYKLVPHDLLRGLTIPGNDTLSPRRPVVCPHLRNLAFLPRNICVVPFPRGNDAFNDVQICILTEVLRSRCQSTALVSSLESVEVLMTCHILKGHLAKFPLSVLPLEDDLMRSLWRARGSSCKLRTEAISLVDGKMRSTAKFGSMGAGGWEWRIVEERA